MAECRKFECRRWDGKTLLRPRLEKRGAFWCCAKCGDSYGKDADFAVGFNPFDCDSVE
jgi:hypothetical protein